MGTFIHLQRIFVNVLAQDACCLVTLYTHQNGLDMAEREVTSQPQGLSLSAILDTNGDISYPEEHISEEKPEGWDEENGLVAKKGYCVECEGIY